MIPNDLELALRRAYPTGELERPDPEALLPAGVYAGALSQLVKQSRNSGWSIQPGWDGEAWWSTVYDSTGPAPEARRLALRSRVKDVAARPYVALSLRLSRIMPFYAVRFWLWQPGEVAVYEGGEYTHSARSAPDAHWARALELASSAMYRAGLNPLEEVKDCVLDWLTEPSDSDDCRESDVQSEDRSPVRLHQAMIPWLRWLPL